MAPGAGARPGAGTRVRRRGPAPGPPAGLSARGDSSFAAGAGLPQAPMLGQAARRGDAPSPAPGPRACRAAPPPGLPPFLPPAFRGAARGRAPGAPPSRGTMGAGRSGASAAAPGEPLRSAERTVGALHGRASLGQAGYRSVPPPELCGQPLESSPRLPWLSPAGPSRGSRRSQAEPSGPPGLHQRPPPPERPPAELSSRAPEYS